MQEYLSLPFSYMTFVMMSQIEEESINQYSGKSYNIQFDPVAFNYLFNKGTSFLDCKFLMNDKTTLDSVLSNLK